MTLDDLVDLFAGFRPVVVRRMFGGAGVFADGLMFALQLRDELYLKVDAPFSEALADLGSSPFTYSTATREARLPYWRLPDAALDDEDLRHALFARALQVAQAAARAPKGKRKGPAPAASDPAAAPPPDLDLLGLVTPAPPAGAPLRSTAAKAATKKPRATTAPATRAGRAVAKHAGAAPLKPRRP